MLIPKPGANMRIIKQLPPGYSDSQLYDLFRHFGSIESVHSQSNFGPDTGIVEFWYEEDAIRAEAEMHCVEVEGHNISVQGYQPKRNLGGPSEFNTSAPAFIPSGSNIFQYTAQVSLVAATALEILRALIKPRASSTHHRLCVLPHIPQLRQFDHPHLSCMGLVSKSNSLVRETAIAGSSIPATCSAKYVLLNRSFRYFVYEPSRS